MHYLPDQLDSPARRMAIALFLATTILVGACSGPEVNITSPGIPVEDKVQVVFYLMSKCPYAAQVVTNMDTVVAQMGEWIDFNFEFIGNDKNGELTALHGTSEVEGNILWLCTKKHMPKNYAYFKLAVCMSRNFRDIPGNWVQCANELSLHDGRVEVAKCLEGEEGRELARRSFKASAAAGARGSPTMHIGGAVYKGGRAPHEFMRAICFAMPEGKTAPQCAELPAPLKFQTMVLTDKRCTDRHCDVTGTVSSLKFAFPGMTVRELDWAEAEARKVFAEEGLDALPAILFPPEMEKAEGYDKYQRWFSPSKSGRWLSMKISSNHDPRAEICDNGIDDTGDLRVDCEAPECHNRLVCRKEVKGQLELFVMSQCPYAVKAFSALRPVLEAFADDGLNLQIHYLGDNNNGPPTAMHGQSEVDENIRQLCVARYFPKALMDYIWCRGENIRSDDWEPCATKGLEATRIRSCFDGEGTAMLLGDIKVARALDIRGSPTWIVNGRHRFNGITPDVIQEHVCKHNPEFKGCEADLSGQLEGGGGGCAR